MELHDQIKAAVEARMELARATSGVENAPFDGTGIVVMRLHAGGIRTVTLPSQVTRFLAANDPAAILRHCERDLRVLERHAPFVQYGAWACAGCYDSKLGECSLASECDEVRDLATAYGIEEAE